MDHVHIISSIEQYHVAIEELIKVSLLVLSRGYTQIRNVWSCVPTCHVDQQLHVFVATQTYAANLN